MSNKLKKGEDLSETRAEKKAKTGEIEEEILSDTEEESEEEIKDRRLTPDEKVELEKLHNSLKKDRKELLVQFAIMDSEIDWSNNPPLFSRR